MLRPVGFASDITEDAEGLMASFTIPEGEAGDKALAEARAGVRDGLSVGVQVQQIDRNAPTGVTRVTLARIYETSLVSVPAFENTLVSAVTAAHQTTTTPDKEHTMDPITTPETPETPETTEDTTTGTPVEGEFTGTISGTVAPSAVTASINAGSHAPASREAAAPALTITAAADRFLNGVREGHSAASVMAGLTAALQDVVPANDTGEAFLRRSWIGEVWQASSAERPLIDAFGAPQKLDGLKAYGWRWDKTPTVGKYNFDKKDVPSNQLSMVPVEGDAQGFAAGWDVSRKYVDLGATGFIERVFQLAADDYKRQTEEYFVQNVKAAATNDTTVKGVLDALGTLPRRFATRGARLDILQFGAAAWDAFLSLKESDVPWWLRGQGTVDLSQLRGVAANVSITSNPSLADTDILAADRRAATFYELGATPIRAQALDIARGGIDLGVYGYAAHIINDPRAIVKATTSTGAAA